MPIYVPFDIDEEITAKQLDRDQMLLNENAPKIVKAKRGKGDIGIIGKIKRYYRQFGFKSTVRRFFEKLIGR